MCLICLLILALVAIWYYFGWTIAGICALVIVVCIVIGCFMTTKEVEVLKPDRKVKQREKKRKKVDKVSSVPAKKNENKKQKPKQQTVEEKPKKLPVDLELIKYVPENKLGEVVNSLSLKYGLGAAAIWAAIHEARKDVTPVVHTEDRVYREDFYGDERERDVYLNDYELDELDDDERDELLEDLDDDSSSGSWCSNDSYGSSDVSDSWNSHDSYDSHDSYGSHDNFSHDDYGHDSWGDNDY